VNLGIGILDRLSGVMGFLSARRMKKEADAMIERMRIVPPDPDKEIQLLSGGNQQKVMVGRWLSIDPKVIIFDEPTHGIDVGTKVQVYSLMMDLACEGRGILLISSEFVELVSLADRILVIWQGRLVRELPGPGSDVDALFAECVGKGNT
jgi:ABC-type sugar transport system ATPase subunit